MFTKIRKGDIKEQKTSKMKRIIFFFIVIHFVKDECK